MGKLPMDRDKQEYYDQSDKVAELIKKTGFVPCEECEEIGDTMDMIMESKKMKLVKKNGEDFTKQESIVAREFCHLVNLRNKITREGYTLWI